VRFREFGTYPRPRDHQRRSHISRGANNAKRFSAACPGLARFGPVPVSKPHDGFDGFSPQNATKLMYVAPNHRAAERGAVPYLLHQFSVRHQPARALRKIQEYFALTGSQP
jgi:hypothetical protein